MWIRDFGDGIEAGAQHKIFEPFFTSRAKGTGLGLTLAKRIVEGHGGQIRAFNHEEGGAVFELSIPAKRTAAESS